MRFTLDKSPTEQIVIEDSEYKGRQLVTLRIYFLSADEEWLPTKKGVTFKREQLADVIENLQKIAAG